MHLLGKVFMGKKIAVLICIFILFGSCSKKDNSIHIAGIFPLTGDASQWGVPPKNAATMAVDEINAAGGIQGKRIVFDVQDDQCEPAKGVSALQNLIATYKPIALIGAVCSSVSLAIAPIVEQNKIIMISPASTSPLLTNAGDYVFRDIPTDKLRSETFARYIFSKGVKELDILFINNDGGLGATNAFVEEYTKLRGKVMYKEGYQPESNDFRAQIAKAKKSPAAAIMIVSYPNETSTLLRQFKELNLKKRIFALTEALDDPAVLKRAKDAAEGVEYIVPAPAEGEKAAMFVKNYEAKFGVAPPTFAAEAYDAIYLIRKILEEAPDAAPEKLKEKLYEVKDFIGASGTITFDQNGDVIKPMAIKKIMNQSQVIVTTK
jgi:branched-chain amino acid transport system substrate-binding protein